jgi:signal peptidase II
MKRKIPYFILIGFLLVADQVTKSLIERHVARGGLVTVIPGFFNLRHVRNDGAIFGFLAGGGRSWVSIGLLVATLIALAFVLVYFFKAPAGEKGVLLGLTLIATGALGNLIDRVLKGYVVDFVDWHIKDAHWPFFNVADSCITVGAVLLLILFVFKRRH